MARKYRRRSGGLTSVTIAELHREISRRQKKVGTLLRRRDRLAANLAAVDTLIREHGGAERATAAPMSRGRGRGRARNKLSLAESLAKVLKGKTMSVIDAAAAVKKSGYRSGAANFRTMVNLQLIKSDKFKRMGRGQYTAV